MKSRYVLHLVISNPSLNKMIVLVIYNSHQVQIQRKVWEELSHLNSLGIPWSILGYFNAITAADEHKRGRYSYYFRKASFFSDFIFDNSLLDIGYIGSIFSRCNGRNGFARHWARLDRCVVNHFWLSLFYSYNLLHLPRLISKHSPILLIASRTASNHSRIFRFENH